MRTNFLKSILCGVGKAEPIEVNVPEEYQDSPTANGDGVNQAYNALSNYENQLEALENSEELRLIYIHPQWQEFLRILHRARTAPENANNIHLEAQIRAWCLNHPQIGQMLAWFHHCTCRYGLSFDPFVILPRSRLLEVPTPVTDPEEQELQEGAPVAAAEAHSLR